MTELAATESTPAAHASTLTALTKAVKAARRVSAPLIGIQTPDPAETIRSVMDALNGKDTTPYLHWDCVTGLTPLNEAGTRAISEAVTDPDVAAQLAVITRSPVATLALAADLAPGAVIFFLNAHRQLTEKEVVQAIWNLRDPFKENGRTLVLLAPQLRLPAELTQDVLVLDEALPTDEDLAAIVTTLHEDAGLDVPVGDSLEDILPALRGLAAFPAEQALAMSLKKEGVDIAGLWARKKQAVEQTPGLRFVQGNGSAGMESIGGLAQIKSLLHALFTGPAAPKVIVFVDEIEKAVGGSGASGGPGDSSGVSQDQLGTMLKSFDDLSAVGLLLVGPPGTGKSTIAKAAGETYGVPTIFADFGAAKGSLVGESEANIRQVFKVIHALAGDGGALFLATSNRLEAVPPELQRRLGRFGVWMVDLPDPEERADIWRIAAGKWHLDLTGQELPDDADWTGADITNCCELAYRTGMEPKVAADFLAPVAKSNPEGVNRIRAAAHNRFRSASQPGFYDINAAQAKTAGKVSAAAVQPRIAPAASRRALKLED